MVHIDLINGLSGKEIAVDFIQKFTRADGIITTKPALIKRARELELSTILRFFVIDSWLTAASKSSFALLNRITSKSCRH